MICSLLDHLPDRDGVVLVTVLHTEGHTYKKAGDKAVFVAGDPLPAWGNLGSLCADQEIADAAAAACADGRPLRLTIDMSDEADATLGYGTYCGGRMELLVEPVLPAHRVVYRDLLQRLRGGMDACLVHKIDSGELTLRDEAPDAGPGLFVESFAPPHELVLFGATPLARAIVSHMRDMDLDLHVIDWRQVYLDALRSLPGVQLHLDDYPLNARSLVVIVSHSFERDLAVLEKALSLGCGYVGLLSSRMRRDKMFEELSSRGTADSDFAKVSSPVGIDIGGRSDAEIAVGIVAEIVRHLHS